MINLPSIEVDISRKQLSIKAIQDGSIWPDRSEELEILARRYFAKHKELTREDKIKYLFWLIRNNDFVIFTFGNNPWNYLQFIKHGENLVFNFPYGRLLGNRPHQIDRVERILRLHGIKRYITPLVPFSDLTYDDYFTEKMVYLDANFGNRKKQLATKVVESIVAEVFHLPPDCKWEYVLGSQRGIEE